MMLHDEKEGIDSEIKLGPNVSRLALTKDGRIAFGYTGTHPDELPCFKVLSPIGQTIYECRENTARACIDLTVDSHDNIWASCYPDALMYEINTDKSVKKHSYPTSSPDTLIPFSLNGKEAMILSYSADEVYTPINYVYVDGELLEAYFDGLDSSKTVGISAYAGLVIVFAKDNTLHFFKLDQNEKTLEA